MRRAQWKRAPEWWSACRRSSRCSTRAPPRQPRSAGSRPSCWTRSEPPSPHPRQACSGRWPTRAAACGSARHRWPTTALTATAEVRAIRGGRDTLFVRTGGLSGHGVTMNWEWAQGSLSGPNWTVPGRAGCLDVAAHDADGGAVRLEGFDHVFPLSLDPQVLTVDSLVFSAEGTAGRLCLTGRSAGQGRVAVTAWDTTSFRYFGEYARYHVLQPPVKIAIPSRWELGVGQSHPVALNPHGQSRYDVGTGPRVGAHVRGLRRIDA